MKLSKKKRNRIFLLAFLVVVVVIALIFTLNYTNLRNFTFTYVQQYGLTGILILAFALEMLWQPIGPEVPISIGILFGLNPVPVFIFTLLGSSVASLFNYYVGKGYLSKKLMVSLETGDRSKYRDLFKKYGKWGVFLAAIGPVPWVPFCWLAGSFKMKFKRFAFYGLIPRAIRILIVVILVGYLRVVLF
tara:strand:- start:1221 stop:1787 length:567 start_codon:yes stop_codon:yes gene_type:complete